MSNLNRLSWYEVACPTLFFPFYFVRVPCIQVPATPRSWCSQVVVPDESLQQQACMLGLTISCTPSTTTVHGVVVGLICWA